MAEDNRFKVRGKQSMFQFDSLSKSIGAFPEPVSVTAMDSMNESFLQTKSFDDSENMEIMASRGKEAVSGDMIENIARESHEDRDAAPSDESDVKDMDNSMDELQVDEMPFDHSHDREIEALTGSNGLIESISPSEGTTKRKPWTKQKYLVKSSQIKKSEPLKRKSKTQKAKETGPKPHSTTQASEADYIAGNDPSAISYGQSLYDYDFIDVHSKLDPKLICDGDVNPKLLSESSFNDRIAVDGDAGRQLSSNGFARPSDGVTFDDSIVDNKQSVTTHSIAANKTVKGSNTIAKTSTTPKAAFNVLTLREGDDVTSIPSSYFDRTAKPYVLERKRPEIPMLLRRTGHFCSAKPSTAFESDSSDDETPERSLEDEISELLSNLSNEERSIYEMMDPEDQNQLMASVAGSENSAMKIVEKIMFYSKFLSKFGGGVTASCEIKHVTDVSVIVDVMSSVKGLLVLFVQKKSNHYASSSFACPSSRPMTSDISQEHTKSSRNLLQLAGDKSFRLTATNREAVAPAMTMSDSNSSDFLSSKFFSGKTVSNIISSLSEDPSIIQVVNIDVEAMEHQEIELHGLTLSTHYDIYAYVVITGGHIKMTHDKFLDSKVSFLTKDEDVDIVWSQLTQDHQDIEIRVAVLCPSIQSAYRKHYQTLHGDIQSIIASTIASEEMNPLPTHDDIVYRVGNSLANQNSYQKYKDFICWYLDIDMNELSIYLHQAKEQLDQEFNDLNEPIDFFAEFVKKCCPGSRNRRLDVLFQEILYVLSEDKFIDYFIDQEILTSHQAKILQYLSREIMKRKLSFLSTKIDPSMTMNSQPIDMKLLKWIANESDSDSENGDMDSLEEYNDEDLIHGLISLQTYKMFRSWYKGGFEFKIFAQNRIKAM